MRLFILALMLFVPVAVCQAQIATTKHNLSKTGPGTVKSATEDQICVFCHTPHGARSEAPLWNRGLTNTTFTTYSSATLNASVGQPTGASKLCLSCHDGTIALNALHASSDPTDLNAPLSSGSSAYFGSDLSDDHPVSFTYDATLASADGQLVTPASLPATAKLEAGKMQCTSCHDPHKSQYSQFLRTSKAQLCTSCHTKTGFASSAHNVSVTGSPVSADYPCKNCHLPHKAPYKQKLLRGKEEEVCFTCHGASALVGSPVPNGAGENIQLKITGGTYGKYDTNLSGRWTNTSHDITDGQQASSGAHMECVNCHGPHAVKPDDLSTAGTIESLADPDNPNNQFTWGTPSHYNGSDPYWRKIYRIDHFCMKCHDGGMPSFPSRPEWNVLNPTANSGKLITVSSSYNSAMHTGSKSIPCMICHDPHGGNPFLLASRISWTSRVPFATRDANQDAFDSGPIVVVTSGGIKYELCRKSCHVRSGWHATNRTNCQSCHKHGSGRL